jgi:hypothetical protein
MDPGGILYERPGKSDPEAGNTLHLHLHLHLYILRLVIVIEKLVGSPSRRGCC